MGFIMLGGDKRGMKPLLLKFGVALALSFAGFLYSRLRTKRITPSLPPPRSPRHSEHGSDVDSRTGLRKNVQITHESCHITSNASDKHEDTFVPRVASDNTVVGLVSSGDRDGYLLPEFNDLVKEFDPSATSGGISPKKNMETPRSDETPKAFRSFEDDHNEQEIKHLKNMVRILRERERNLEVQLLEYYGLKEQETAVMELQNRLRINNMEAKFFSLKIDSLQADNRRLEAQVSDYSRVVGELESARTKIKILKKKLRYEAEQNKEQIITLQNNVAELQEQEQKSALSDHNVQLRLQKLKDLEMEAEELRKSNMKLQMENSDLARRLESTQIIATSVLEDHETEELKEISHCLKQKNEDLSKEIEQLQADRCADVEELVYLRWINACLRFELRNYQPPPGKTFARDLSKTLSPKSEEKAKQLILEYANTEGVSERDFDSEWSSSQASYLTDSGELDDSPCDNSSANRTNTSSKVKFLGKLRRLIRGKDSSHHSKDVPEERTSSSDDIMQTYSGDTPRYSSSISAGNEVGPDGQSNRFTNSSRNLSRKSMDIQKTRSLNKEDIKDLERVQRSRSNVGSSHGYRRFGSNRGSISDRLDEDSNIITKAELVKYAEILKDTKDASPKIRKSSSYSSY